MQRLKLHICYKSIKSQCKSGRKTSWETKKLWFETWWGFRVSFLSNAPSSILSYRPFSWVFHHPRWTVHGHQSCSCYQPICFRASGNNSPSHLQPSDLMHPTKERADTKSSLLAIPVWISHQHQCKSFSHHFANVRSVLSRMPPTSLPLTEPLTSQTRVTEPSGIACSTTTKPPELFNFSPVRSFPLLLSNEGWPAPRTPHTPCPSPVMAVYPLLQS